MPLGRRQELLGWWVWRSDRQLKLKVLTIGGSPGRNGYIHHQSLMSTRGCLPFQGHSVCPCSGKVFKGMGKGTPAFTVPGDGRHAMEVDRGRRRNAWSLENNEQDLGLWEKLYSSKGRIKSSLITTLTWWLP